MSLPKTIPQQSVPFGQQGPNGEMYVEINWYLFLYNLSAQVLGTGRHGSPASCSDLLDIADLNAEMSDVPQAYRKIANLAVIEAQDIELPSADLQLVRRSLDNLAALEFSSQDIPAIGPSLRDLANAILLATDPPLPEPRPAAQPVQTVTVGASPFTYTAPFNGVLSVTAGTVSAISIIRQGVTIATSMTSGLISVSRLDQVQITYTSAPTVVFLPS